MVDLKDMFKTLGFSEITTYIQSGNVAFFSKKVEDNVEMENQIAKAILKKFEFEVPVIVRTFKELSEAVKNNPFVENNEIERLHLTFLKEIPLEENLKKITTYDYSPDKFLIKNKSVFIYCDEKYSKSKLTNKFFESKLKVSATTRNWKTVMKLLEMSRQ